MSLSSPASSSPGRSGNFTFSGRDSAFSDGETESPLTFADTIGTSLDEYSCAAQMGRTSFCKGDALAAIQHFDQALDIELQAELECMYDTSLGHISGLLRREVDTRLHQAPAKSQVGGPLVRKKVLQELEKVYRHAEGQSEHKPTAPMWYLRMGAALCMVDEWEKARRIYTDGLLACKDKGELRQALDNLNTIEKLTAGIIVPQDVGSPLIYSSEKDHSRRPKRTLSASSIKKHVIRKFSSAENPRKGSADLPFSPIHRGRNRSNSLEDVSPPHQAVYGTGSPGQREKSKKNSKKRLRRPNSSNSRKHSEPQVPYEDRLAWADSFGVESEIASSRPDYVSSAVVHMRRLALTSTSTVDDESDDSSGAELKCMGEEYRGPFRAIGNQKDTIRVDLSDDSELEFD